MAALATSRGFKRSVALTELATRDKLTAFLAKAAKNAMPGDIVWVSYSGHGGQVPDLNRDEGDGKDETWCLFDGQIIDDELWIAWSKFRAGVRILVTSDCCHSGTVARDGPAAITGDRLMPSPLPGSCPWTRRGGPTARTRSST